MEWSYALTGTMASSLIANLAVGRQEARSETRSDKTREGLETSETLTGLKLPIRTQSETTPKSATTTTEKEEVIITEKVEGITTEKAEATSTEMEMMAAKVEAIEDISPTIREEVISHASETSEIGRAAMMVMKTEEIMGSEVIKEALNLTSTETLTVSRWA